MSAMTMWFALGMLYGTDPTAHGLVAASLPPKAFPTEQACKEFIHSEPVAGLKSHPSIKVFLTCVEAVPSQASPPTSDEPRAEPESGKIAPHGYRKIPGEEQI